MSQITRSLLITFFVCQLLNTHKDRYVENNDLEGHL